MTKLKLFPLAALVISSCGRRAEENAADTALAPIRVTEESDTSLPLPQPDSAPKKKEPQPGDFRKPERRPSPPPLERPMTIPPDSTVPG